MNKNIKALTGQTKDTPFALFQCSHGKCGCQRGYGNYFESSAQQFTCSPCPVGHSSTIFTQESCFPCSRGKYAGKSAAMSCSKCEVGEYTKSSGSSTCDPCPPGSFSEKRGSPSCKMCSIGTYQPNSRSHFPCAPCLTGRYTKVVGSTSCTSCPLGTYNHKDGSKHCIACPFLMTHDSRHTGCVVNVLILLPSALTTVVLLLLLSLRYKSKFCRRCT